MKYTCIICGKEISEYRLGTCYECDKREEKLAWIFGISVLVGVVIMVGIVKFAWAEFAYHDWRCMFSECRIIKP